MFPTKQKGVAKVGKPKVKMIRAALPKALFQNRILWLSSVTRCWKKLPKSSLISFYLKSDVFQNSPRSHQELKSGHTSKVGRVVTSDTGRPGFEFFHRLLLVNKISIERTERGKKWPFLNKTTLATLVYQCDQMAKLFVQILVICNNENFPNCIHNLLK